MNPVRNFVQILGKSGISNGVKKPAVWVNIILLILLVIILILAFVGCVDTHKKRWWEQDSVFVHQR